VNFRRALSPAAIEAFFIGTQKQQSHGFSSQENFKPDRHLRDLILRDDEQVGTFRKGTGFLSRTIYIDVPDEMPLLVVALLLWISVLLSAF